MKRISKSLMWVLILCLPASFPAIAQTITGSIRGTITDASGAIVPGAAVTATNVATNVNSVATTNQAGEYSIRFLPIGRYKVSVTSPGFNTAMYGPFPLEIDQTAKIDIPLSVGTANTTVTVSDQTQPILNTENATLGETFTSNTITRLPIIQPAIRSESITTSSAPRAASLKTIREMRKLTGTSAIAMCFYSATRRDTRRTVKRLILFLSSSRSQIIIPITFSIPTGFIPFPRQL
jgi:hypothetical protein